VRSASAYLAVLAMLRGGQALSYRWDATADAYLDGVGLSATVRRRLGVVPRDQELDEATLTAWLDPPRPWIGPRQRTWFRAALALAASRAQGAWPPDGGSASATSASARAVRRARPPGTP